MLTKVGSRTPMGNRQQRPDGRSHPPSQAPSLPRHDGGDASADGGQAGAMPHPLQRGRCCPARWTGGGHGPPARELRGAPRACRADVAPDIGLGLLRVIAQPADVVAYARPDVVFGLVASVGAYAGDVHGRVAVYPARCKGRAADIGYHFADGVECLAVGW